MEQVGWVTDRQWKLVSATSHESSAMANPSRHGGDGHQSNADAHSTKSGRQQSNSSRTSPTRTTRKSCCRAWYWESGRMPLPSDEVKNLKLEVDQCAATRGYDLRREAADKTKTPIDFRFLQLLLTAVGDL